MSSAWPGAVRHVIDGERGSAAVISRPDRQLEGRGDYLRERLDAAEYGEYTVANLAPLDTDVLVGMAVYWNAEDNNFQLGLADSAVDVAGVLSLATSALVQGIVLTKRNATLGDIVTYGRVTVDLANSVDDPTVAGLYYLSATEPGKLTLARPGAAVPVLYNFGNGTCLVCPAFRAFASDHVHHRFELVALPAGEHTPPDGDDPHVIDDPDSSLPGWLPADDAIFAGLAPSGAVFGYNIALHPELQNVFPPQPASSAVIFWDRGEGGNAALASDAYAVVDNNGIWWMTDCDVPWNPDYDSSSSGDGPSDCPVPTTRVIIAYHSMLFANAGVVTSLTPKTNSAITLENEDGDPATRGDLLIDVDLDLTVNEEEVDGATVLKTLEDGKFNKGKVLEGAKAGTNVQLSSTGGASVVNGISGVHQGIITVSAASSGDEILVVPTITRFGDSVDRYYKSVPYIGLPAGRESGVRLSFKLPRAGLPDDPVFVLRAALLARSAGSIPDLAMTYRTISPTTTLTALPTTDTTGDLATAGTATADQFKEFTATAFEVVAGDLVLVELTRSDEDGYSGELGLLWVEGAIQAAS